MRVAIVDYGSGNLRSVKKAFERAARDHGITADIALVTHADEVLQADRLVLPGVGAYADCRAGLDSLPDMTAALQEAAIKKARPFLGICVGMQLMSTCGLEKQETAGLNWISGDVIRMTPSDPALKIPQIGWNTLELSHGDHPLFAGIPTGAQGQHAYFVHSYHFDCQNPQDCLATTDYGGKITAAIGRDNLLGTQFHPEKSQHLGLRLIANFLEWKP